MATIGHTIVLLYYRHVLTCFVARLKKNATKTRSTPNLTSGPVSVSVFSGVRGFITAFVLPISPLFQVRYSGHESVLRVLISGSKMSPSGLAFEVSVSEISVCLKLRRG